VLGQNNINIEMISQGTYFSCRASNTIANVTFAGASEINISCVIEEREADRALNVVHTNLFTFLD
jgi:aspartokinase